MFPLECLLKFSCTNYINNVWVFIMACFSSCQPFPSIMYKDKIHKIWSPEIYSICLNGESDFCFKKLNKYYWIHYKYLCPVLQKRLVCQHYGYEVIWESNSWFSTHDGNNSTKTVSPRLMPDVQYVYIHKFARCFLILVNPFIILTSIIFIFINSISIY